MPLRPNIFRALLLLDAEGVVPPMPPGAFFKVEVVVILKEEEGSEDVRPKWQRIM